MGCGGVGVPSVGYLCQVEVGDLAEQSFTWAIEDEEQIADFGDVEGFPIQLALVLVVDAYSVEGFAFEWYEPESLFGDVHVRGEGSMVGMIWTVVMVG